MNVNMRDCAPSRPGGVRQSQGLIIKLPPCLIFLERCLYLEMDVYVRGGGSDAGTRGAWPGFW